MAYVKRLEVRFDLVDYARVVYYPRYFELSHQVFEAFFADEVKVSYPTMLQERGVGFPTVHCEADFRAPLAFGDQVDVVMETVKASEKSLTCRYRFVKVGASEPGAVVTVVTAAIDMKKFAPCALPDDVRSAFLRHAP